MGAANARKAWGPIVARDNPKKSFLRPTFAAPSRLGNESEDGLEPIDSWGRGLFTEVRRTDGEVDEASGWL